MGDVADMIIEGALCDQCGVYIGPEVGYPRSCDNCKPPSKKTINRRQAANKALKGR